MKRQHHKSMDFWRGVRRHFARALPFLWDRWKHWNSINTQFYWFLRTQNKMKKLNNLKLVKTADSIPQVFVRVLKLFNVLSSSMKTTKHCKTQWTMTFSNMSPAELQLRSGEPQAFFSSIYIYHIHRKLVYLYYMWLSFTHEVLHESRKTRPSVADTLGDIGNHKLGHWDGIQMINPSSYRVTYKFYSWFANPIQL